MRQNTADTIGIARYGAKNCSLANNMQLDDLSQYQVTESLAAFHLASVVNELVTWCFPYAQRVQNDVANLAGAHTAASQASYTAALQRDTRDLNRERARIDADPAERDHRDRRNRRAGAAAQPPRLAELS